MDDENHKDAAAGPLFDFGPVIRYCNGLAVAALVSYILVIAALFAVIQTSPVAAKLDVTELLLVTLALVLPTLITALVLFVALRALAQSMRAFASVLAGMPAASNSREGISAGLASYIAVLTRVSWELFTDKLEGKRHWRPPSFRRKPESRRDLGPDFAGTTEHDHSGNSFREML